MNKRLVAIIATAVVIAGGGAYAAGTSTTLPCTLTDGETSQTLNCEIPKPAPVTQTVSVPGPTVTVTRTVTPSATPTTPSSTPTTTTPTPTPTPTPTDPPQTGFPDASNTGWQHTGVTLRTVRVGDTGNGWNATTVGQARSPILYVTKAGAVLDGLDIPMCVKVMANNVTISRSRIACASDYTVNVSDPPNYYSGLKMTDVELDGLNSSGTPVIAVMASSNAVYTRLNVHGFGSSGPRMASGAVMQDSYIHDFICKSGWHSAGSSANGGGSGIKWLHNNVDVRATTGPNACASNALSIYLDEGPNYDGVQMIGNRIAGGAYGVYTLQNQGAKNVRVENNTFVRGSFVYGPAAQVASGNGNTYTGNVYDDGTPIN